MARADFVQINLKLPPELLEKIDAAVAKAGNTNRSDWLRATITSACEGRFRSLPASGGSSQDHEARTALVALKDRIDDLEDRYDVTVEELQEVKNKQVVALSAAAAVTDSFAEAFLSPQAQG